MTTHARQALPRPAVGTFDREREYLPADAIKILKGSARRQVR